MDCNGTWTAGHSDWAPWHQGGGTEGGVHVCMPARVCTPHGARARPGTGEVCHLSFTPVAPAPESPSALWGTGVHLHKHAGAVSKQEPHERLTGTCVCTRHPSPGPPGHRSTWNGRLSYLATGLLGPGHQVWDYLSLNHVAAGLLGLDLHRSNIPAWGVGWGAT